MEEYGCCRIVEELPENEKLRPEWKASTHIMYLRTVKAKTKSTHLRQDRETTIINMYNGGHSIDDIWQISRFKSRSSIFRILRKYGVTLNRDSHSGPIKKRSNKSNSPKLQEDQE